LKFLYHDWTANGEVSVDDFEDNLLRTFDVFDRLQFKVSNLKVANTEKSREYKVTYHLSITSKIHKRRLKRKEKARGEDLVVISGESGKEKTLIKKTLIHIA